MFHFIKMQSLFFFFLNFIFLNVLVGLSRDRFTAKADNCSIVSAYKTSAYSR